jgi:hypothetical protein
MATAAATKGDRPVKRDQEQDQIGAQHDQVAMGEIDQPHDAEHQRQAGSEQRVQPAKQDPLDDGIDPDHAAAPK